MKMPIKIILLISCSLMTTSCVNLEDSNRTRIEGSIVGCLAGAALGHLLRNDKGGLVTGCAAGTAAGYVAGNHVAKKKEQYTKTEDYLKAVLKEAEKVALETRSFNSTLTKEVKNLQARQQQLNTAYTQRQNKNQELVSLNSETQDWLKQVEEALSRVENEINTQKDVLALEQTSAPSWYVVSSEDKISQLQQEKRTLLLAFAQLDAIDKKRVY